MSSCQSAISPQISRLPHPPSAGYRGFLSPTATVGEAPARRFLPARLDHARNLSRQRQLAEADTAKHKFAEKAARPSALLAAVAVPDPELRCLLCPLHGEHFVSG